MNGEKRAIIRERTDLAGEAECEGRGGRSAFRKSIPRIFGSGMKGELGADVPVVPLPLLERVGAESYPISLDRSGRE